MDALLSLGCWVAAQTAEKVLASVLTAEIEERLHELPTVRKRRHLVMSLDADVVDSDGHVSDSRERVPDPGEGPESIVVARDLQARVEAKLTSTELFVLQLTLEGYSAPEIAKLSEQEPRFRDHSLTVKAVTSAKDRIRKKAQFLKTSEGAA